MRNQNPLRSFALLAVVTSAAAVIGCGEEATIITVMGKSLKVVEQTYGLSGPDGTPILYCQPLFAGGQYQVFITDFPLCSQIKNKVSNSTIFHSSDETNMRLIFPSFFMKNPDGTFKPNPFKVGKTIGCTSNASGASAVAIFSHNTAGQGVYDLKVEADSGTITVTAFTSKDANIKGTFDLVFGADRITGAFDAFACAGGIGSDYGK